MFSRVCRYPTSLIKHPLIEQTSFLNKPCNSWSACIVWTSCSQALKLVTSKPFYMPRNNAAGQRISFMSARADHTTKNRALHLKVDNDESPHEIFVCLVGAPNNAEQRLRQISLTFAEFGLQRKCIPKCLSALGIYDQGHAKAGGQNWLGEQYVQFQFQVKPTHCCQNFYAVDGIWTIQC